MTDKYEALRAALDSIDLGGSARHERFLDKANPETIRALLADHDAANARLHDVATLCATVEQERDALREAVIEYLTAQDAVDNNEYQSMPESFGRLNERRKFARDALDAALTQGEQNADQ